MLSSPVVALYGLFPYAGKEWAAPNPLSSEVFLPEAAIALKESMPWVDCGACWKLLANSFIIWTMEFSFFSILFMSLYT